MNTGKGSQQSEINDSDVIARSEIPRSARNDNVRIRLSKLRRFVMFGILALFLLQFVGIKALVGGLTGSVAFWFVRLMDVFAYFESLIASRDFTISALLAVLPIIGVYLIFGRAFCGWVCPMDFLYEMVDRAKVRSQKSETPLLSPLDKEGQKGGIPPKIGYIITGVLLIISTLIGIPFFTNYISHLTNLFRLITGGVFVGLNLPAEPVVLIFSGGIVLSLLILEFLFPRLWCRVLCPVGKTYGLLNKISLIRLKFLKGECGECNLCDQSCYMKVKIARHIDESSLRDINCIYCGRCMEGCETKGKLIKIKF